MMCPRLQDSLTAEEDSYLCDLNNFVEEHSQREAGEGYLAYQIPPVPADLLRHYVEDEPEHCHCVIDARDKGEDAAHLACPVVGHETHCWQARSLLGLTKAFRCQTSSLAHREEGCGM